MQYYTPRTQMIMILLTIISITRIILYINLPLTYPVCLQTTTASLLSQESSHTVPYIPLIHISTLPSELVDPLTSRISPYEQATRRWESR